MPSKKPNNSRRKPVQNRSRETVDAILEATAQILSARGYAGCSTNQIAERAGVSIGGLYQYFPDKESILKKLCVREVKKDAEAIEECLKNMADAPIEKLTPMLIAITVERLSDQPRLRLALMNELPIERPKEDLRIIRKQLAALLTERLKTYSQIRVHEDMQLDILILVSAVEAAIYAAIQEYGTSLNRTRLVESVSDLVLRYLSKYSSR